MDCYRSGSVVPFHLQKELVTEVGSLLLMLELDDNFDLINDFLTLSLILHYYYYCYYYHYHYHYYY